MEIESEKGDDIIYFVDIPKVDNDGLPSEEWYNVHSFETEKEALEYATKYFGADSKGRVCLISRA